MTWDVLVDRTSRSRRAEIPKAESIVEQELESFISWRSSLAATPVIKAIREHFEHVREHELAKNRKRFCAEDREQIELLTESLVNKILHPLMGHVRDWSDAGELGALRIDSLYEAFDLKRPNASSKKKP